MKKKILTLSLEPLFARVSDELAVHGHVAVSLADCMSYETLLSEIETAQRHWEPVYVWDPRWGDPPPDVRVRYVPYFGEELAK